MSDYTQDHIHIDACQYAVLERMERPRVTQALNRTLGRQLRVSSALDNNGGDIVREQDMLYTLRLTEEYAYIWMFALGVTGPTLYGVGGDNIEGYKNYLKVRNGKYVTFVDNNHVPYGSDHTPFQRTMLLQVGDFKAFTKQLTVFEVDVTLIDPGPIPT